MSEVRKPVATVRVKWGNVNHKFELFQAAEFAEFIVSGHELKDEEGRPTLRVRHNGVWLPKKSRQLFKLTQVTDLIQQSLVGAVGSEKDLAEAATVE